jgi:hypothetical protein
MAARVAGLAGGVAVVMSAAVLWFLRGGVRILAIGGY